MLGFVPGPCDESRLARTSRTEANGLVYGSLLQHKAQNFSLPQAGHDSRWLNVPPQAHPRLSTLAFEVKTATPSPGERIAVYGTDSACVASRSALRLLVESGYYRVRRYSGGLKD